MAHTTRPAVGLVWSLGGLILVAHAGLYDGVPRVAIATEQLRAEASARPQNAMCLGRVRLGGQPCMSQGQMWRTRRNCGRTLTADVTAVSVLSLVPWPPKQARTPGHARLAASGDERSARGGDRGTRRGDGKGDAYQRSEAVDAHGARTFNEKDRCLAGSTRTRIVRSLLRCQTPA